MSKQSRKNKARKAQNSQQNNALLYGAIGLGIVAIIAVAVLALTPFGGGNAAPAVAEGAAASAAEPGSLPAEVSAAEGYALREEGYFVLDVREQSEWENDGHIPGATLIPLGELEARLDEIPADQPVLVYCRSGNRSQAGRDILLEAGFDEVTSMAGGINGWKAAGYEYETGP